MLETLFTAALLGLIAGLMPGAYTTVVASAALEHGFRAGARLALVPLFTDVPPMLLMALVLHRVDDQVLTAIGVVGGIVVVGLGVRLVARQRERATPADTSVELRRTFWAIAVSGLLSPAPWIFWLGAAGPLLLRAWYRSPLQGVAFGATLMAMLIGTALAVAWLAARGRRAMAPAARRRALRVVGVALGVMGAVMVWQSLTGNFQRLIREQQTLRERIGAAQPPTPFASMAVKRS